MTINNLKLWLSGISSKDLHRGVKPQCFLEKYFHLLFQLKNKWRSLSVNGGYFQYITANMFVYCHICVVIGASP